MLIRNNTGGSAAAVPLATMAAADRLSNGNWRITASNGETYDFTDIDWQIAIETTINSVFPALPGTYLISPNTDFDEPPYWRSNVLGWMNCADGAIRPAVLDVEALLDGWTVLHPDGRVEGSEGSSWDNVTDWLAIASIERGV